MPYPVMLFAAGLGTRMGALTADRPKPMVPVAGRPLIDYALDLAQDFGAAPIVANVHYKPDTLIAHLQGRDVLISHERDEVLETGGGLKQALPLLGPGPVFTMNTDAVWRGPNPFQIVAGAWDPDRMDALLLCAPRARAISYQGQGDFLIDADGRLTRGAGHVYLGLQIVKTGPLADVTETKFSLWSLWQTYLDQGRMFAVEYPGQWCDVGHPEGIVQAEAMLSAAHV